MLRVALRSEGEIIVDDIFSFLFFGGGNPTSAVKASPMGPAGSHVGAKVCF